jgi:ferric-dicitrate binding protein FerR (iron transport regulator)
MGSSVSDNAAGWLVRLETSTTPAIWDDFQTWMDADPRHRAVFIRLKVAWNHVDSLRHIRPLDGMIDADLFTTDHDRAAESRTRRTSESADRDQNKINMAPGSRLAAIAEFLLTRASYKRYVRPIIADMQEEYIDCIAHRREWKARWVVVRGHFLVVPSWIYTLISRVAKQLLSGS